MVAPLLSQENSGLEGPERGEVGSLYKAGRLNDLSWWSSMEQAAWHGCDKLLGPGGYKPRLTATFEDCDRGNSCMGSAIGFNLAKLGLSESPTPCSQLQSKAACALSLVFSVPCPAGRPGSIYRLREGMFQEKQRVSF